MAEVQQQLPGGSTSPQYEQQLFSELKHRFPEVPADVIKVLMKQNFNNREKSIDALGRESNKYLYGPSGETQGGAATPDLVQPMNNVSIGQSVHVVGDGAHRGRSDSSSSRTSVGSAGSGHKAVTPTTPSSAQGALHFSKSSPQFSLSQQFPLPPHANSSPLLPQNLEPFLNASSGQPQGIPCVLGGTGRSGETSPRQHAPGRPPPPRSPNPYMGMSHTASQGYNASPTFRPSNTVYQHQTSQQYPPQQHHQQQPGQWPQQWPYHTQTSTSSPLKQQATPPSRPGKFAQNFPAVTNTTYSPGNTPSPQHQYSAGNYSPSTPPRENRSGYSPQHQGQYHTSYGSPVMQGSPGSNKSLYPSHVGTPPTQPHVLFTSGVGKVHMNISGQPPTASSNQVQSGIYPHQGVFHSQTSASGSGSNTPTTSYNPLTGQAYLPQITWQPNGPGLPANIQLPSHGELGHTTPMQPSRSSSHSSLPGSDTPGAGDKSSRSGSLAGPEDIAYTQALILHQRARLQKLMLDVSESKRMLDSLRADVQNKEAEAVHRRRKRSATFPSVDDVQKMRDDNRKLQIDIQLMTREIDMFTNGQNPILLGVVGAEDPNFYRNIGTGPQGSIHAPSSRLLPQDTPLQNTQQREHQFPPFPGSPPPRPPPPANPPAYTPRPLPANTFTSGTVMQAVGNPYGGGSLYPPARAPIAEREETPPHEAEDEGENWNCTACTFLNHPALDKCECCEMPRVGVIYR